MPFYTFYFVDSMEHLQISKENEVLSYLWTPKLSIATTLGEHLLGLVQKTILQTTLEVAP